MEKTRNFQSAVEHLQSKLTPRALGQIGNVFTFNFKDTRTTFILDGHNEEGKGWLKGCPEDYHLSSNFVVTITTEDFAKLIFGELNPMAGMVTGRMQLKGNIKEALKLDRLLKGE